jgi:chromosome segregation ATPase
MCQQRSKLEAEVARNQQAQAQLRHDLDELQKQFEAQRANYIAEQSKLEARSRESEALAQAQRIAEQQRWHQRELELEQGIRQQQDQLANSASAAAIQEVEFNRLRSANDDLRVIQSALCARVRELTAQHDAASRRLHELDGQSQAAKQTIQKRDQQLTAMRNAILDAARIGTDVL